MNIYKFLNNLKLFNYYFISPYYRAIGTMCEDTYCAKFKVRNKKLIILYPNFINKKKYKICNKFLIKNIYYEKKIIQLSYFAFFV